MSVFYIWQKHILGNMEWIFILRVMLNWLNIIGTRNWCGHLQSKLLKSKVKSFDLRGYMHMLMFIGLPVYHWSILAEELKSVFCDIIGRDMTWIRLQNRYCMLVQSLSLNFPIWVYPRIHDGSVTLKRFLIGKDRTRSGTIMRRTAVDSMNEIAHFRQAFFWC